MRLSAFVVVPFGCLLRTTAGLSFATLSRIFRYSAADGLRLAICPREPVFLNHVFDVRRRGYRPDCFARVCLGLCRRIIVSSVGATIFAMSGCS